MKIKKKAFTLIETIVAIVILITIITAMATALVVAIKSNKDQQMQTLAASLAEDILSKEVRQSDFSKLYEWDNPLESGTVTIKANASDIVAGSEKYVIKRLFASTDDASGAGINSTIYSNTTLYPNFYSEFSKLPKERLALLRLGPVCESSCNGSGTPVYSPTRLNIKITVAWNLKKDSSGNIDENSGRKVEISSVYSRDGITIGSQFTPFPITTGSKTIEVVALDDDDPCSVTTNKPLACTCSSSGECASGSCVSGQCVTADPCSVTINKPLACTCSSSGECASGSCVSGQCVTPTDPCTVLINKPLGCSCTLGTQCSSGSCISGSCATDPCSVTTNKPFGCSCSSNGDCASNKCNGNPKTCAN